MVERSDAVERAQRAQKLAVDGREVSKLSWVLAPDYRGVCPAVNPGQDEWAIAVDSRSMLALCTHSTGLVAVLTIQHLSYVV